MLLCNSMLIHFMFRFLKGFIYVFFKNNAAGKSWRNIIKISFDSFVML